MSRPADQPLHTDSSASFDPVSAMARMFVRAIRAAYPGVSGDIDPLITAAKQTQFGDFQCNAAMSLAKREGVTAKNPREVAAAIVGKLAEDTEFRAIAEPLSDRSIAGPGFINITLKAESLASLLAGLDTDRLGIEPAVRAQTVVVDLMGVNLAKQMHVGHLRSPIIGDAIARTLERLGHRVIRQNHVGDWGLPIAMVTARLLRESKAGRLDLNSITLDHLDSAYKAAQAECQRDIAGLEAARKYGLGPKALAELEEQAAGATEAFTHARDVLLKLQSGDAEAVAVWRRIADVTMAVCIAACRRLHVNVTQEHSAGESSYAQELAPLVAELQAKGVAEQDQGALIVRLDEPRYGSIKEPCLIRKSDGGFLYATTDVAAVRRRVQKLGAERLVYAIDQRQNLHLRQMFGVALKAGYATIPNTGVDATMQHAAFGMILGDDGRPFKTRTGDSVKLADLLDETVTRAATAVTSRQREQALSPDEAAAIAEAVGIAALKFTDLSTDRIKDYVFSFDRMLAFEGFTGPYLLYALVRVKSIFRKAVERGVLRSTDASELAGATYTISQPAEKALALALLRYPGVVQSVGETLEPHRLCQYLYEVAQTFSTFFDACPVLIAESEELRLSRLKLCALTGRVLEDGLRTLGIPTLDRM